MRHGCTQAYWCALHFCVTCRLFLKDPQYPLKEPLRFGEGLAEGLVTALHAPVTPPAATAARTLAPSELVLLLSACAVALMKHHPLVADTLATQGYVAKFTALLAARLPPAPPAAADAAAKPPPQPQAVVDEGGALLRLIHALVASTAAAEALATVGAPGAVATLSGARAWGHTAEVLVLETMKRALSESNRTRDTLVSQALQVRATAWMYDKSSIPKLHACCAAHLPCMRVPCMALNWAPSCTG